MKRRDGLAPSGVQNPKSGVKTLDAGRRTPHAPPPHTRPAARGFSLVEILVVMGIIAFLTAAIVVVLPRIANASKVAATRATVKKVDELLNDRMNAFKRWINNQDQTAGTNGVPSYIPLWAQSTNYKIGAVVASPLQRQAFVCTTAGTSGASPPTWPTTLGNTVNDNGVIWTDASIALAKILAIKQLVRQNFPQTFSDMVSPPSYTASHNQNTESGACLYIILTQAAVFDTEPPAAADLKAAEVADTDLDGLPEVVDAYGQPLRFYRWPTRLIRAATTPTAQQSISSGSYTIPISPQWTVTYTTPTPNQTSVVTAQALMSSIAIPSPSTLTLLQEQTTAIFMDLAKDPNDPSGLIQVAMTQSPPLFTPAAFETTYHTPDTYFIPLVLSAGPADLGADANLLGLYEPWDTANFGNLAQPVVTTTNPAVLSAVFGYITNQQR